MSSIAPLLLPAGESASRPDPLRLAAAAYLARFTGPSRTHTESDLRIYLAWCAERSVDPLTVERAQVELYVRWMQEVRRLKPSTVSRRMSVVAGFYRTCHQRRAGRRAADDARPASAVPTGRRRSG
jgi:site-specific recombinase XerD